MQCLHCHNIQPETNVFCPHCGQKSSVKRLQTSVILKDALKAFVSADRGFRYLLKWLPFKAGTISREYVEGQRKK